MKLYVLRHGQAGAHSHSDRERSLTSAGVADICRLAEKFTNQTIDFAVVSPYIRTQQSFDYFFQFSRSYRYSKYN